MKSKKLLNQTYINLNATIDILKKQLESEKIYLKESSTDINKEYFSGCIDTLEFCIRLLKSDKDDIEYYSLYLED